jgi:ribosomal protein S18 acetylase RimI-like enzyme
VTGDSTDARTQAKVPFEWTDQHHPINQLPVELSWTPAEGDERTIAVIAASLSASPDESDQTTVAALGATEAAQELLGAVAKWGCHREPEWWKLLVRDDEVLGFVLPVTYLETPALGTIFHMGIRPTERGQGFGRLLLREATRTLLDRDVRRIFCDTDQSNAPMIHLFETEGWTRLPEREVPLPNLFHPGQR